jgi:hypothetical protein
MECPGDVRLETEGNDYRADEIIKEVLQFARDQLATVCKPLVGSSNLSPGTSRNKYLAPKWETQAGEEAIWGNH